MLSYDSISIRPYYKPLKISSYFSLRERKDLLGSSNVVYQFLCPEAGCNATYIGYTTNTLRTRALQHRYSSSNIYSHFQFDHQSGPPLLGDSWLSCFSILHRFSNKTDLLIAESLEIKNRKPVINTKYNELYSFLCLY